MTGPQRPKPAEARAATFAVRRRGLHPDQVYAYLRTLADEIERLHRNLTTAHVQNERIRQALRQWRAHRTGHPVHEETACLVTEPHPTTTKVRRPYRANRGPG